MSRAKWDRFGNWERRPAHHCSGSQVSKSSCGSEKNSSNSFTVALGRCLYRAVKLTFWGDVEDVDGTNTGCCWVGGAVNHLATKAWMRSPMTIKIAHHITICRRMNWFQDAITDYRKVKVGSIILPWASRSWNEEKMHTCCTHRSVARWVTIISI